MKSSLAALAAAALLFGCQSAPPPAPTSPVAAKPPVAPVLKTPIVEAAPVALLEPYLVAFTPSVAVVPPPSLGGHIESGPITPLPEIAPLVPAPPTQTVPVTPKTSPAPSRPSAPSPKTSIPPAVVRLLEDERARSVDEARSRLAAASARAAQTAAEAKKQWEFVRQGFVAQKTAENADSASKSAADELNEAQKALDEAQQRQRNARRDLQTAFSGMAEQGFSVVRLEKPLPAYRPMPFTYRLSILGSAVKSVAVENGTLGRALPTLSGEGGAWIVRCADPSRVRVHVSGQVSPVIVHGLPSLPSSAQGAA